MSFHLGKPILVMLVIALISGAFVVSKPAAPQAELVMWTFAEAHADTYKSIIAQFEAEHHVKVDIQNISLRAETVRLESMFMSGQSGRILPDVVEMEIQNVGRFFRPPVDEIGFLPLNDYLKRDNWDKRIVPMRFATWSKQNVIFGVPHDVHPVAIVYRQDLFQQAGIDLEKAKTWSEFQDMCLKFQDYWRAQGKPTRHAIELPLVAPDYVIVMLLQRGVNLVDQNNVIHMNDPIVAQTIAFYAQMVAGPRKVGWEGSTASNKGLWAADLLEGNLCASVCADWRVYDIELYAPGLSGKMRAMPLPRFEPTDTPTSTWGGTMIGITRNSKQHELAWKLIQFLYLSQTGHEARLKKTNIIPPVMEWWDHPVYHERKAFFGGQSLNELYVDLARQVPPRYVSPATTVAQTQLSVVIDRAVKYVNEHGTDGLEEDVKWWLNLATDDLKRRVDNGKFEE
jgi:ABC-type glycerol-3-phosphate transport system substrate-binding protein